MATINKVLGGYKSKANGEYFENILHTAALYGGFSVTKIPLGAKQIGKGKLVRIRTPFDFIFWKSGRAIIADAKHTSQKNFSYGQLTDHQVLDLADKEKHGFVAGYIVYFMNENIVSFFKASQLKNMQRRESLSPQDGIVIGDRFKIDLTILLAIKAPPEPPVKIPQSR